ncbi:hypothetical protein [Mycolicibacterium sediminis]|uniref:Ribonuclease Z n=1 Tax=Mycolicibacterium sediminis TaxID=1286180 RepID=A0A7I7QR43_9MYCO|nr:hypothetical protein [Mycolicibacterium sediminis]BBY28755.1 ribonuclease Z [Mycolicibacterium sediminis]
MATLDWTITFVGTGSLFGAPHRAFPSTLITTSNFAYLVDCGDGTVSRLRQIDKVNIDLVVITEIGSSEMGGVLTLGETSRRSTRRPLPIVGPPGLLAALESLAVLSHFSTAEMFDVTEAEPNTVLHEHHQQYLEAVPVAVNTNEIAYAYMLFETPKVGRVDAEKAARLGIKGADFSALVRGESVRGVRPKDVIGPPRPGRRVVIAGRGRPTQELRAALQNSDVAILSAPFTDDRLEVAEDTGYLTGWEAAKLARDENVRLCALQRLGPFSPPWYQLQEAGQFFDRLVGPEDGSIIRVPLPENGRPQFRRAVAPSRRRQDGAR